MGKMMSRRSNKFSAFEFNEEDKQVEKHSQQMLKKFGTKSPRKSHPSPIDKYTFLRAFSKQNKDARECASPQEFTVLSTSSDHYSDVQFCSSGCDAKFSKAHSSRGAQVVVTSTSSSHCDDTQQNLPSHIEMITVTSDDDDDDNIGPNSTSRSESCQADDLGVLLQEVHVCKCDLDKAVVFLPKFVVNGDEFFSNPRLTFSSHHIKLEGSVIGYGPSTIEWTVADIVNIECQWCEKLSTAALALHIRSKDIKVAITGVSSGIVELKWDVTHPRWLKIQDIIWALNVRYKASWKTDSYVDAATIEDNHMDKFSDHFPDFGEFVDVTYPKGDLDAVSIGSRDIQLLQPETFINDTIIDFYLKYLKHTVKREEVHRFHFFNSFFFRKLADLDRDLSIGHEGKAAFLRVHKWTKKINLFEKEYIFIPVNFSLHWSLIVICHPGEVANLKDEEMEKLCRLPCILHMDSIRGSHRGLQNIFRSYLLEEWKERHNDLMEDFSSRFWKLPFFSLELPQQENYYDCGLFLLHYAELFTHTVPENYNHLRNPKSSNFLSKNWFTPVDASLKRAHIKELIYRIVNDCSGDGFASDKSGPSESASDKRGPSESASDKRGPSESASDIRGPSESAGVDQCKIGGHSSSEIPSPTNTHLVSFSDCTITKKFGTEPVVAAGQCLQRLGEAKLNSDAMLDPEYHGKSLSDGYHHPARQYNQSKSIISPVEVCEESEDHSSATSNCVKELKATDAELLPGAPVQCEELNNQGQLHGTSEIHVSGDKKSAVLVLDFEEDKNSQTLSDEIAACVVEDSLEVCGTEDDNECQSSTRHLGKFASSDQVDYSTAIASFENEETRSDDIALCIVDDSEEQCEIPGSNLEVGFSSHQEVTPPLCNQDANPIEMADSTNSLTPLVLDTKEQRKAKRPRNMRVEGEEPLNKRFQMIVID